MIYIQKKSVAEIPPASGSVSDTLNVTDKITNAPSIRLMQELLSNISSSPDSPGTSVEVPTKTSQLENDSGFLTDTSIQTILTTLQSQIYNDIYPVGRVFIDENVDSEGNGIDYSNYLGFTWEKTLKGVSPVGVDENDGDFNNIGNVGGEKEHILSIDEMPSHTHIQDSHTHTYRDYYASWSTSSDFNRTYVNSGISSVSNTSTSRTSDAKVATNQNTGGDQAHNNLSPYKVVAFWKRVA